MPSDELRPAGAQLLQDGCAVKLAPELVCLAAWPSLLLEDFGRFSQVSDSCAGRLFPALLLSPFNPVRSCCRRRDRRRPHKRALSLFPSRLLLQQLTAVGSRETFHGNLERSRLFWLHSKPCAGWARTPAPPLRSLSGHFAARVRCTANLLLSACHLGGTVADQPCHRTPATCDVYQQQPLPSQGADAGGVNRTSRAQ